MIKRRMARVQHTISDPPPPLRRLIAIDMGVNVVSPTGGTLWKFLNFVKNKIDNCCCPPIGSLSIHCRRKIEIDLLRPFQGELMEVVWLAGETFFFFFKC